jgi:hypothetical protein
MGIKTLLRGLGEKSLSGCVAISAERVIVVVGVSEEVSY